MAVLKRDLRKTRMEVRNKIKGLGNRGKIAQGRSSRGRTGNERTNRGESGAVGLARRVANRYIRGQTYISDLSRMNYAMMRRMIDDIRERAAKSGQENVAVILENHTKDIYDFSDIERFLEDVAHSADVKTVTLREIADGIRNGTFKVRTA